MTSRLDRRIVRGMWIALLGLATSAAAQEPAEESVVVFRQLKPSVVALKNAEGAGTGIILQKDGMILTNAHVVSSPLPYEVTIDVETPDGAGKQVIFKRVEVLGTHKRLDLALVRLDAAELKAANVALKPAVIHSAKADPGQRVYVIGNPGGGGQTLNKSISSGMVSGVDREYEGEKYYQTDAAINPGNSGGPMCNRAGNVLGLVTFKFTDVQAIGFAIPLYNLDFKEFVPLAQRKSDSKQAGEMIDRANEFVAKRDKAIKARRTIEDPEVQIYSYYAAMCFRQALSHDPSNPAVYYMIGMLMRTIDEDQVGAAYLARSIQLAPFAEEGHKCYRELGFAMAKQKQPEKAGAVWREGLEKFPYDPIMWDDLAVWNMQRKEYLEAAKCATVSLMIGNDASKHRVATMRNLVNDARRNLATAGKTADADKALQQEEIAAMLDAMLAKSNGWRAQRTVCFTKEFADFMADYGGYAVPGVEKTMSIAPQARHPAIEQIAATPIMRAPVPAAPRIAMTTTSAASADWMNSIKIQTSGGTATTPGGATTTRPAAVASTGGGDWLSTPGGTTGKTAVAPPVGTVDFIAAPGRSAPLASVKVAPPVPTGKPLASAARQVVDAQVQTIAATGVVGMEWSADTAHVYMLQGDGVLRKVAVADMKEERQLAIGTRCAGMARCSQGLAILVSGAQEIWIVDDDLNVRRRAAAIGAVRMTASAALPLVFHVGAEDALTVIDLDSAKSIAPVRPRDLVDMRNQPRGAPMLAFRSLAATPDGRFLFAEGGEAIHRLRIEGTKVVVDERGPRIAATPAGVTVSADSLYVSLPAGPGNLAIPPALKVDPFSTYVFKVEDLKTPVMTLKGTAYPRNIAFDATARSLYGQALGRQLVVFSPDGARGKEYTLTTKREANTVRFLVHPKGKTLFVQADPELLWVTLP